MPRRECCGGGGRGGGGGAVGSKQISNLVFYARSTITVISGRNRLRYHTPVLNTPYVFRIAWFMHCDGLHVVILWYIR